MLDKVCYSVKIVIMFSICITNNVINAGKRHYFRAKVVSRDLHQFTVGSRSKSRATSDSLNWQRGCGGQSSLVAGFDPTRCLWRSWFAAMNWTADSAGPLFIFNSYTCEHPKGSGRKNWRQQ